MGFLSNSYLVIRDSAPQVCGLYTRRYKWIFFLEKLNTITEESQKFATNCLQYYTNITSHGIL